MRGNPKHEQDMKDNDIKMIDLVVLNLYAFEDTVKKGYNFETCIENIDIGGPSMLRSSAKNHAAVVICSGCTTIELRRRFAAEAFALSAKYDAAISSWFAKQLNPEQKTDVIATRPYLPVRELKYGVNPHQKPAGLYRHISACAERA